MTYQEEFNLAYVAWRPPVFAPFYYGLACGAPNTNLIDAATRQALINTVLAMGYSPVEQIESWVWDPYTVMCMAALYGDTYFPPGQGNVQVNSVSQAGAVVPFGGYTGTPPKISTPVITDVNQLTPWSTANPVPVTPVDPVGLLQYGPYYAALGNNPPAQYTDSRGTFILTRVFTTNVLGQPQIELFYVLN